MFRLIAAVLFIIGAVIIAVNSDIKEPLFWLLSGLAAWAISGSKFERSV